MKLGIFLLKMSFENSPADDEQYASSSGEGEDDSSAGSLPIRVDVRGIDDIDNLDMEVERNSPGEPNQSRSPKSDVEVSSPKIPRLDDDISSPIQLSANQSTNQLNPPQLPSLNTSVSHSLRNQDSTQDGNGESSVDPPPSQVQLAEEILRNFNDNTDQIRLQQSQLTEAESDQIAPSPTQSNAARTASPTHSSTTCDQPSYMLRRRSTINSFSHRKYQLKQEKTALKQFSLTSLLPRMIPQPICHFSNEFREVIVRAVEIQLSLWNYHSELEILDLTIPENYVEVLERNNEALQSLVKAVLKNLHVKKVDCVFLPCCGEPSKIFTVLKKLLAKVSLIKVSIHSFDADSIQTVLKGLKKSKVDFESQYDIKFVPRLAMTQDNPDPKMQLIKAELAKLKMKNLASVVFGEQVLYGKVNTSTRICSSNSTSGYRCPEVQLQSSVEMQLHSDCLVDYDSSDPGTNAVPEMTSILSTLWSIEKIHEKYQGENTVIAVIDSGIDVVHPAFLNSKKSSRILAVKNFGDDTPECTQDDATHGTMCAGIACGQSFQGYSEKRMLYEVPDGVAPKAYLVVCIAKDTNQTVKALKWILSEFTDKIDYNVDVISISIGSPTFRLDEAEVVSKLAMKNVIIVAAASNAGVKDESPVSFPAAHGNVLCIGSHDVSGNVSSFSASGKHVHFLAPGENMIVPCGSILHSGVRRAKGTSVAAPALAGLICLIIEAIRDKFRKELGASVEAATHNFWVMRQILCEILARSKTFNVLHPESQFFANDQCQSVIKNVLRNMSPATYEKLQNKK